VLTFGEDMGNKKWDVLFGTRCIFVLKFIQKWAV